jgi:hypothetical protein
MGLIWTYLVSEKGIGEEQSAKDGELEEINGTATF